MNIDLITEKYLNESDKYVSKGIFSKEGKKVNLQKSSRMFLSGVDSDDFITHLTWKEYKKLNVETNLNEYIEKKFIQSLLKQLKRFSDQVDFNGLLRTSPNISFEEKVDWLLKKGAKYTKKGILEI